MSLVVKITSRSVETGVCAFLAGIVLYLVPTVLWDLLISPGVTLAIILGAFAVFLWLRSHLTAERLGRLVKRREKAAALVGLGLVWTLIGAAILFLTFPLWGMSANPVISPIELLMIAVLWLGILLVATLRVARSGKAE